MTRVILMAAAPRDSSGQAVVVRLQGGGRYPAQYQGEAWLPALTDWPDLQQELPFDGLTFGGGSAANIGQVRFALNGGRLAWLTELIWTRAPVMFYIGEDGDAASFTVLWRGRARSLVADANDAELTLADPALVLERALLTGRYAGTGGTEGDASVQGVLKRLAWGQPNNVGLTLIEKANLIYASVDQAVVFRGIKQGGLSQSVSGDVASLAALRAAVIPAGRVATCAALGLVRPAAEPTYPLTADLTIAGPRTPAALAGTLAARAGLAFAAGQIAAFDSLGQEIDLVVSDELTLRQALDQIFAPLGAWWRLNAAGALECGRYLDPSAATVSLPGHLTLSHRRLTTQPPVWRSVIGHDVNWRPLADGEIAGIIRAAEVEGLGALATQDGVDWDTQVGGTGKPESNATNDRGYDTRNDDFSPAYYRNNYALRLRTEFKDRAAISAPGTVQYGVLYTLAKWANDTGGPVEQQFVSESGVFYRRGTNAAGWGAWVKSFDEMNRPDFAASDVLSGGVVLRPGDVRNNAIVLSSDGNLSFNSGFGYVNLGSISINQVPGQITSTQIASNAITTPLLAANAVTGDKLAANNVITSSAQIGLAVIQAANIGSLDAGTINAGFLSASRLSIDGVTLSTSGGQLIIKGSGVNTEQMAPGAAVTLVGGSGVGFQQLTANAWLNVAPSGVIAQWTITNAAYSGRIVVQGLLLARQSGSNSDAVQVRLVYGGVVVSTTSVIDVSGGGGRANPIPFLFFDDVPAGVTRTYVLQIFSDDQTAVVEWRGTAQLVKRT